MIYLHYWLKHQADCMHTLGIPGISTSPQRNPILDTLEQNRTQINKETINISVLVNHNRALTAHDALCKESVGIWELLLCLDFPERSRGLRFVMRIQNRSWYLPKKLPELAHIVVVLHKRIRIFVNTSYTWHCTDVPLCDTARLQSVTLYMFYESHVSVYYVHTRVTGKALVSR